MKKTSQRRENILHHLVEKGSVEVSDLVKQFGVTPVTIRHDLTALEEQGLVTRAYGGAYLNRAIAPEQSVTHRDAINHPIKERIGAEAAKYVNEKDAIIINAGSTTLQLAKHLKGMRDLTVMTNSLYVASELADAEGVELMITGGTLRKQSMSFQGPQAERSLNHYRFDKLFFGVDGMDVKFGITTHSADEAALIRRMVELAREIIAVTDSSKIGKIYLHNIALLDKVNTIITDTAIDPMVHEALIGMKVKVILVPAD
jgi:DeoR family transcriptional regulator of aga operon